MKHVFLSLFFINIIFTSSLEAMIIVPPTTSSEEMPIFSTRPLGFTSSNEILEATCEDVWIKSKNEIKFKDYKKTFNSKKTKLSYDEICQSTYLSECDRLQLTKSTKKSPLEYDGIQYHIDCKHFKHIAALTLEKNPLITKEVMAYKVPQKNIGLTYQEIKFFKEIIHKANTYGNLNKKKYGEALRIAEKVNAVLLYAELLEAQMPPAFIALVTQKYKELCKIDELVEHKIDKKIRDQFGIPRAISNNSTLEYELVRKAAYNTIKSLLEIEETSEEEEEEKIVKSNLTHIIILEMICQRGSSYYPMHIKPNMPGFNALNTFFKKEKDFYQKYFSTVQKEYSTKKKKTPTVEFRFLV